MLHFNFRKLGEGTADGRAQRSKLAAGEAEPRRFRAQGRLTLNPDPEDMSRKTHEHAIATRQNVLLHTALLRVTHCILKQPDSIRRGGITLGCMR